MRSTFKYFIRLGLVITGAFGLASCEKTFDNKLPVDDDLGNETVVQVFNAVVNSNRTQVFVDGKKVSGATITQGTVFPANPTYGFAVPGGLRAWIIRDTLGTSAQVPLVFSENMQVDRHQTIFFYDTITSPKQKTVIDNIVAPDDTTARIRFANFVYNPTMVPAVDIYSVNRGMNIFTNVSVTDVTDFIPYASGVTDTVYIRPTGTNTNLQNVTGSTWSDIRLIFTPTIRRSYTIVFWGSWRTTNTASAFERQLAYYSNR
jgi:hypothetical protein